MSCQEVGMSSVYALAFVFSAFALGASAVVESAYPHVSRDQPIRPSGFVDVTEDLRWNWIFRVHHHFAHLHLRPRTYSAYIVWKNSRPPFFNLVEGHEERWNAGRLPIESASDPITLASPQSPF